MKVREGNSLLGFQQDLARGYAANWTSGQERRIASFRRRVRGLLSFQEHPVAVKVEEMLLASRKPANVDDFRVFTPIFSRDGRCAMGDKISVPLSSNPINPRSNKWSMVGVRRRPFSPLIRSSLVEMPSRKRKVSPGFFETRAFPSR